jgi:EAL domain-containing protein (putative c-di-GMP-specific phosphodiesterase class I)
MVVAELAERFLTADPAQLLDLVTLLRSHGWGIALDGVGADRNSLASWTATSARTARTRNAGSTSSCPTTGTS